MEGALEEHFPKIVLRQQMWVILRQVCTAEMQQIGIHACRESAYLRAKQLGFDKHKISQIRVLFPQRPFKISNPRPVDAIGYRLNGVAEVESN